MGMLQTKENVLATSQANCFLIGRYIKKPFEHIMLRQSILMFKTNHTKTNIFYKTDATYLQTYHMFLFW